MESGRGPDTHSQARLEQVEAVSALVTHTLALEAPALDTVAAAVV